MRKWTKILILITTIKTLNGPKLKSLVCPPISEAQTFTHQWRKFWSTKTHKLSKLAKKYCFKILKEHIVVTMD